jgi:hypothetical protein
LLRTTLSAFAGIEPTAAGRWASAVATRIGDGGAAVLVFLVTGVSGAGKSTVARRLAAWGHRAISLDADNRLCSWMDVRGFGERFVELARTGWPDAGSYMGPKTNIGL